MAIGDQIVLPGTAYGRRHTIGNIIYTPVGSTEGGTILQEVGRYTTSRRGRYPSGGYSIEGAAISRPRPIRRFSSGASFDPNTNTFTYPDGTQVSTDSPEVANRQFVQEQQQQQRLVAERGRLTGFVPAGTTMEERRQRASLLSVEELRQRPVSVVTAGILAKQAVEKEEVSGVPRTPREAIALSKQPAVVPIVSETGEIVGTMPKKEIPKQVPSERQFFGIPLYSGGYGGRAEAFNPFEWFTGVGAAKIGGVALIGLGAKQVAKRATAQVAKETAEAAIKPTIREGIENIFVGITRKTGKGLYETTPEYFKRLIFPTSLKEAAKTSLVKGTQRGVVGGAVAYGGLQAPDIATRASLPEHLQGEVDSPRFQAAVQEGVSKGYEKMQTGVKGYKQSLLEGDVDVVSAGQRFIYSNVPGAPFFPGAVSRKETIEAVKQKYAGSKYSKEEISQLAEAAANRVSYGQFFGGLSAEATANIAGGFLVKPALALTGAKTFVRRGVGVGAVTLAASPVEVYIGMTAAEKATYAKYSQEDWAKAFAVGGISSASLGFVHGGLLPSKPGRTGVDIAANILDIMEKPGDVLTSALAKARVLPDDFVSVSVRPQSLTGLLGEAVAPPKKPPTKPGKPSAKVTPAPAQPVPYKDFTTALFPQVPVEPESKPEEPVSTETKVEVPPPPPPPPPSEPTPEAIITPIREEPPPEIPFQTDVPPAVPTDVPALVSVPVPIYTAEGFPFLPLFGFGAGTTQPGRKQRTELYNELATAMNSVFGAGFVKAIEKRSVPTKKRKKKRKTTKPIRFI